MGLHLLFDMCVFAIFVCLSPRKNDASKSYFRDLYPVYRGGGNELVINYLLLLLWRLPTGDRGPILFDNNE